MYDNLIKGNKVNSGTVTVSSADVTLIRAANSRRVRLTVQNTDDGNYVSIGGPELVADEGLSLTYGAADFDGAGGRFTFVSQGAIYGIADTADCIVTFVEEVNE